MNYDETLAIMGVLKAAYPSYYRDMNRRDAEGVVSLWAAMFADEPAELVASAVKAHIATDTKGFPPHIGAIKTAIVNLTKPQELEMSEMEAWSLVRKAIHGAYTEEWSRKDRYGGRNGAEYHFDRLPPLLQRIVGGPEQLAAWNRLDGDEIDTVIQSNFMRSFRAKAANERELLALPQDIRKKMEQLAGGMNMELESGKALCNGRGEEPVNGNG